MEKSQGLAEKMLQLKSLNQVVEEKIAAAKADDTNIDSRVKSLQLQLRALRQRTLLRTFLQLRCQLRWQRLKLDNAQKTVYCRRCSMNCNRP